MDEMSDYEMRQEADICADIDIDIDIDIDKYLDDPRHGQAYYFNQGDY